MCEHECLTIESWTDKSVPMSPRSGLCQKRNKKCVWCLTEVQGTYPHHLWPAFFPTTQRQNNLEKENNSESDVRYKQPGVQYKSKAGNRKIHRSRLRVTLLSLQINWLAARIAQKHTKHSDTGGQTTMDKTDKGKPSSHGPYNKHLKTSQVKVTCIVSRLLMKDSSFCFGP